MSLINLTPHPVRVYRTDAPGVVEDPMDGFLFQVEPADKPARIAMIDLGHAGTAYDDTSGQSTWIEWIQFGHVHDLPQPAADTRYIVSLVVALAAPGRTDLIFPTSEVRNPAGTVIGCRGFGRVC